MSLSATLLDHIFTNYLNRVRHSGVIPLAMSDNFLVFTTLYNNKDYNLTLKHASLHANGMHGSPSSLFFFRHSDESINLAHLTKDLDHSFNSFNSSSYDNLNAAIESFTYKLNCIFTTHSSAQYGFRKGHSCTTARIKLTDNILQSMDMGQFTGSVFLDLSEAFDTVSHNVLLEKLAYYNFSQSTISFFTNYLSNQISQQQHSSASLSCPHLSTHYLWFTDLLWFKQ